MNHVLMDIDLCVNIGSSFIVALFVGHVNHVNNLLRIIIEGHHHVLFCIKIILLRLSMILSTHPLGLNLPKFEDPLQARNYYTIMIGGVTLAKLYKSGA